MPQISTTVLCTINLPRPLLFEWFIPIQLADILLGYGPLPAVVKTSRQSGAWDKPGSNRTVHLADGNTAFEEVTVCERPSYFAYRVSKFTNVIRFFARDATGQWWFEEKGRKTYVKWKYTFYAYNAFTALLLFPIVQLFWNGYMRVGMKTTKQLAEQQVVQSKDGKDALKIPDEENR
ncbi:MAG: SRPBCC family protein [Candidatus Hodarchaeota archaeon]